MQGLRFFHNDLCSMEQICADMKENGLLLKERIVELVDEIISKEDEIRK